MHPLPFTLYVGQVPGTKRPFSSLNAVHSEATVAGIQPGFQSSTHTLSLEQPENACPTQEGNKAAATKKFPKRVNNRKKKLDSLMKLKERGQEARPLAGIVFAFTGPPSIGLMHFDPEEADWRPQGVLKWPSAWRL